MKGVFRKCDISEYISHVREESFIDSELLIYFYQTSFLSLVLIEIKKFFILEEDLNISSYFAFITIFYIIGKMHSSFTDPSIAKKDYKTYVICFIIVFSSSFLIYNFDLLHKIGIEFQFLKINHNEIMKIVEDRIFRVLDTTENQDKANEINKYSSNFIIFLYFAIFAFGFAVNFNNTKKEAILDDVLITNVNKNNNLLKYSAQNQITEKLKVEESLNKQDIKDSDPNQDAVYNDKNNSEFSEANENESRKLEGVANICKFKIILRFVLAILLFDHLFKNFLIENKIFSEITFRVIIMPILLILDCILSSICMRYHSMNYLLGNYLFMLEAVEDSKKFSLDLIRNHCTNSLKSFWKFFSTLFINSFLPLLIYFSFLNRADIYYKLNTEQNITYETYSFFGGFLETVLYITFSGFILARCFISNGFFCFYQMFVNNSKVKLI